MSLSELGTLPTTPLSGVIDELGAKAEAERPTAEQECRLSDTVYAQALEARLFHQLLPGGLGSAAAPIDWFENGVRLARWDASLAWVITQTSLITTHIHVMSPDLAARITERDGWPVAGSNAGLLSAEPIGGGRYSLSGTVPFNSGCDAGGGIMANAHFADTPVAPENMRMSYAPAERWEIVRDWDVTGLRGTGTHSVRVDGLVVDESDMYDQLAPPVLDDPLGSMTFGAGGAWAVGTCVAATQLGTARRALDEAYAVTSEKAPPPTMEPLDASPTVRRDLMEAEGRWYQAISAVRAAVAATWDRACTGEPLSGTDRARASTAMHLANRDAVQIVDTVCRVVGTTALSPEHPIAVCARDVRPQLGHISSNHAVLDFAAARVRGEEYGLPIV